MTIGNPHHMWGHIAFAGIVAIIMAFVGGIWWTWPRPTSDQLYGCTVQQQVPNGECR